MKKRGRPSKNGLVGPEHFGRALMVIDAYLRAREGGQKHSAAVRQAVEVVRQSGLGMPISETVVKRVLAEFLPKDSPAALKTDYVILEGEEAASHRRFHAQMLELAGNKITTELTDQDLQKPLKIFKFGFGKRPNYPRHNAKTSNP